MRTRGLIVLVLAASLFVSGIASVSAGEDEIWFAESLDAGSPSFSHATVPTRSLGDGHVGSGVRAVMPVGGHHGANGYWDLEDLGAGDPDELYWRYWIRFPLDFTIAPPYRGKLPGPANTYGHNCYGGRVSTEAAPCWSTRMMFTRDYQDETGSYQDGPDDQTLIGYYTYHLDGPGHRGDILPWDDRVALLDHGRWYCVEGRMRLNTPGAGDGILEGWVGGEPAFSRSDLAWRRAGEEFLDIDSFWFNVYYGGKGTSPQTNEIHFDSFAFGPHRIGCRDFSGSFADDDGSVFEGDIEWLVESGLTRGCNPPDNHRFCPESPISRGEVAAFLSRALELPPAAEDAFADDNGTWFEADINALAAAGITAGCAPNRFCPHDAVTRAAMAAFIRRAFGDRLPLGDPAVFTDIAGTPFAADITWLSAAGITRGCTKTMYCATSEVTRGAVAAFLRRALSTPDQRPEEPVIPVASRIIAV